MQQFIFIAMLLFSHCVCMAKDYEPTTNWPYINDDFMDGNIYMADGTKTNTLFMNIHLRNHVLQCVDANGVVSRVAFAGFDHVKIGSKTYRVVDDKLMQCLYEKDNSYIMYHVEADFDEMLRARMPYGMSGITSETIIVATLGLKGVANEKYEELRKVWYDGLEIPLIHSYIYVVDGKQFPATLKGCNSVLSSAKRKELKTFAKTNISDWHDINQLENLLLFMTQLLINNE